MILKFIYFRTDVDDLILGFHANFPFTTILENVLEIEVKRLDGSKF